MDGFRRQAHDELDKILDFIEQRVNVEESIIYINVNVDGNFSDINYEHIIAMAELQLDHTNTWDTTARDWQKDTVRISDGVTTNSEHGEF